MVVTKFQDPRGPFSKVFEFFLKKKNIIKEYLTAHMAFKTIRLCMFKKIKCLPP